MNLIPENATQIELNGATVPFYKYDIDGTSYIQFDSSKAGHPEPMVNAMTGLQNLTQGQRLVMINSKAPMGLFPKVEADFSFQVQELENGLFKITFAHRSDESTSINFGDTSCGGTGC